jgi:hypothetical protein
MEEKVTWLDTLNALGNLEGIEAGNWDSVERCLKEYGASKKYIERYASPEEINQRIDQQNPFNMIPMKPELNVNFSGDLRSHCMNAKELESVINDERRKPELEQIKIEFIRRHLSEVIKPLSYEYKEYYEDNEKKLTVFLKFQNNSSAERAWQKGYYTHYNSVITRGKREGNTYRDIDYSDHRKIGGLSGLQKDNIIEIDAHLDRWFKDETITIFEYRGASEEELEACATLFATLPDIHRPEFSYYRLHIKTQYLDSLLKNKQQEIVSAGNSRHTFNPLPKTQPQPEKIIPQPESREYLDGKIILTFKDNGNAQLFHQRFPHSCHEFIRLQDKAVSIRPSKGKVEKTLNGVTSVTHDFGVFNSSRPDTKVKNQNMLGINALEQDRDKCVSVLEEAGVPVISGGKEYPNALYVSRVDFINKGSQNTLLPSSFGIGRYT